MSSFNKLSQAEAERLALLAEELGECIQAIGKILRHGYESCHPKGGPSNRTALEREIADVRVAIKFLADAADISCAAISAHEDEKVKAVRKYLHHQDTQEGWWEAVGDS